MKMEGVFYRCHTYIPQHERPDDILGHPPGQRQASGHLERTLHLQHLCQEDLDPSLQRDAEQDVERRPTDHAHHLPTTTTTTTTTITTSLLLSSRRRQARLALGLEVDDDAGNGGVNKQKEEAREEVEGDADEEGGEDLDAQGWVGEHQGGPGHVEEEEVEGGAVARVGGEGEG